jgi:hypothetical protein
VSELVIGIEGQRQATTITQVQSRFVFPDKDALNVTFFNYKTSIRPHTMLHVSTSKSHQQTAVLTTIFNLIIIIIKSRLCEKKL